MRSARRPTILTLAILCGAVLAACESEETDPRPAVVVSIAPQAGLVERIAGDRIRIVTLVAPGESPATYQPTDRQVSAVLGAKAYFRIGVPFENGPWLEAIAGHGQPLRAVDMRQGVTLRAFGCDEEHDHEHEGHETEGLDPHIWLAPRALAIQAETIARVLVDIDPSHADEYAAALAELRIDLERLDDEIREILAPYRGRRVYVFHPSWGYFCDAYGLEQVAIEIEGKEPSESELTAILARAKADRILAIHVQPQITASVVEALARALGVEVRTIDPLARDVLGNLKAVAETLARGWE